MAYLRLYNPYSLSSDPWDSPCSGRIFNQQFGLDLDDLDLPLSAPTYHRYFLVNPSMSASNWRSGSGGASEVINDSNKFVVQLDVSHFSPKEINVKTVDNSIVIHGKHEERADEHGFISREFTRRYVLPKGVEPETVTSKLSSNGVLTIEAPKKVERKKENERVIPITVERAPAISATERKKSAPAKQEAGGDQESAKA